MFPEGEDRSSGFQQLLFSPYSVWGEKMVMHINPDVERPNS
jgi:hypothetical protein